MSRRLEKKGEAYQKVSRNVSSPEPFYRSVSLEEVLAHLKHEECIQAILSALRNRKDADKIFVSALLASPKFWSLVLAATVIVSGSVCYFFHCCPNTTAHLVEKIVNSKVPELLPPPTPQ